jgi:hypothetical protein
MGLVDSGSRGRTVGLEVSPEITLILLGGIEIGLELDDKGGFATLPTPTSRGKFAFLSWFALSGLPLPVGEGGRMGE